jgi:MFS family permease
VIKNPLKLFYLSQILAYSYFWISLSVPYLLYRGLTPTEVFSLMAIYQFFGVILEYPTGILGDRFGYKKASYFANFFAFLAMVIISFPGSYSFYFFGLLVLAFATGLSSGNDMGLLKQVSNNIKKDVGNYNALADVTIFFAAIIGGYLSTISYEFALITSGVLMLFANLPLVFLREIEIEVSADTISLSKIIKDSYTALTKPALKWLFLLIAIVGGFAFTIKTIFGNFGELFAISVTHIGWLIGLGGLARAVGARLSVKLSLFSLPQISFVIGFLLLCTSISPSFRSMAILLMLVQVGIGYFGSVLDGEMHEQLNAQIRGSIFSIKRLVMRLFSSFYLAVFGYLADPKTVPIFFVLAGALVCLATALFVYQKRLLSQDSNSIKAISS